MFERSKKGKFSYMLKSILKTSAQLKRELKFSKNCRESGFQERKSQNNEFVCKNIFVNQPVFG